MRYWIALGLREELTFKQLAQRAGVNERTLRQWNRIFRRESNERARPDREEHAFVELVERSAANAPRIEIVLPGERRVVLDGEALMDVLVRVLTSADPC